MQWTTPSPWLLYVAVVYPLLAYELHSQPHYISTGAADTILGDVLRVAFFAVLWQLLVVAAIHLPEGVLPKWYTDKRCGEDSLELYGSSTKPVRQSQVAFAFNANHVSSLPDLRMPFLLFAATGYNNRIIDSLRYVRGGWLCSAFARCALRRLGLVCTALCFVCLWF